MLFERKFTLSHLPQKTEMVDSTHVEIHTYIENRTWYYNATCRLKREIHYTEGTYEFMVYIGPYFPPLSVDMIGSSVVRKLQHLCVWVSTFNFFYFFLFFSLITGKVSII